MLAGSGLTQAPNHGLSRAGTVLLAALCLLPTAATADEGLRADPLTLSDCYALALKRSETIAAQQELIKETEGRFLQALSGVLPRATFEMSEKRQDGSGGSAFTLKRVPERRFIFSQPLFSGFKEFAAMAGARAERRQRKEEKRRAEHLLLVDVSDTFYLLLEQRGDLAVLETTRQALVQRVEELTQRQALGRSRRSEVASAEAQLRRIEAEMEQSRSDETVARQLLEFLTGLEPVETLANDDAAMPSLESEESYVADAGSRPDVRAAEEAWRVSENDVKIAQAKFWPSVSADANYYTKRAGVAQDVDWDATLTVAVPLFQGGQTVGAVREAAARAREARLQYSKRSRRARSDIKDAYAKLRAALDRLAALEKALQASEESYRLQVEDYQHNLVNTLDVLQELHTLQDVRREHIHATYEAKRLYWQLRVATGEAL